MLGTYAAVTSVGMYIYYLNAKLVQREEIEMRSAQNAIFPLLIAERDREYLKQLRRNRDEEAKLMANVPGWEVNRSVIYSAKNALPFCLFQVGTYYGEPVFKTLPKDKLIDPSFSEFYCHTDWKPVAQRAHIKLWS